MPKLCLKLIISIVINVKLYKVLCIYMYVLVYTPSLLRVLRVFQNQYKQISENHPETPK